MLWTGPCQIVNRIVFFQSSNPNLERILSGDVMGPKQAPFKIFSHFQESLDKEDIIFQRLRYGPNNIFNLNLFFSKFEESINRIIVLCWFLRFGFESNFSQNYQREFNSRYVTCLVLFFNAIFVKYLRETNFLFLQGIMKNI